MFFLSFQTYMIHPCFIYFKREIFKRLLLKSEAAALLEPDYQHTGPGPTVQKEPTWLGHTSSCRNIFSIFFKIFIQSWWTSDSSASHLHFPRVPHVQHSYLVLTWGGGGSTLWRLSPPVPGDKVKGPGSWKGMNVFLFSLSQMFLQRLPYTLATFIKHFGKIF